MKRYNKHIKRYFFLCTLYHLFNTSCNIIYLYEKNSKQNLFQVVFFFLEQAKH